MAKAKKDELIAPAEIAGVVTVVGTEKSAHLKTGKEYHVSAEQAKVLIKKGSAKSKSN